MNIDAAIAHIPRLRRYARALVGDAARADDLVQDTLERACQKWGLWRPPAAAADVEAAQARINAYRTLSNSYVQIPTIKAMVGLRTGNPAWNRTRAPLMPLTEADYAALAESYAKLP